MSGGIQLIVGLANPGKEYAATRHNAGAWFVNLISESTQSTLRPASKFHALYDTAKIDHHHVHLLIPTTYMNRSGQAVSACMRYLKLEPNAILVAHDEIDLPVGTIKLKYDGGDGGHNGLKDIINHLDTKQFYRLRIGVGRPSPHEDTADYVLKAPSKAERAMIDDSITQASHVLPYLLAGDMQKAMQHLHTANGEK